MGVLKDTTTLVSAASQYGAVSVSVLKAELDSVRAKCAEEIVSGK